MKDFAGRTIRIGDKVAYFCSNKSGGLDSFTFIVKDLTAKRVVVYDQQSFGRTKRYLAPDNCVIIQPINLDTTELIPIDVTCGLRTVSGEENEMWTRRRLREKLSKMIVQELKGYDCIRYEKDPVGTYMGVKLYAVRGEENEQNQCS